MSYLRLKSIHPDTTGMVRRYCILTGFSLGGALQTMDVRLIFCATEGSLFQIRKLYSNTKFRLIWVVVNKLYSPIALLRHFQEYFLTRCYNDYQTVP